VVIDSSAIVALLLREPDADDVAGAIDEAPVLRVSAATLVETSIVMTRRRGEAGVVAVDHLLLSVGVAVDAVTRAQARTAREAYIRFGKGRHPAALNFGDCFSYALAKHKGEPLLCLGEDFARTDIRLALR